MSSGRRFSGLRRGKGLGRGPKFVLTYRDSDVDERTIKFLRVSNSHITIFSS
jgi:hypothetical protein